MAKRVSTTFGVAPETTVIQNLPPGATLNESNGKLILTVRDEDAEANTGIAGQTMQVEVTQIAAGEKVKGADGSHFVVYSPEQNNTNFLRCLLKTGQVYMQGGKLVFPSNSACTELAAGSRSAESTLEAMDVYKSAYNICLAAQTEAFLLWLYMTNLELRNASIREGTETVGNVGFNASKIDDIKAKYRPMSMRLLLTKYIQPSTRSELVALLNLFHDFPGIKKNGQPFPAKIAKGARSVNNDSINFDDFFVTGKPLQLQHAALKGDTYVNALRKLIGCSQEAFDDNKGDDGKATLDKEYVHVDPAKSPITAGKRSVKFEEIAGSVLGDRYVWVPKDVSTIPEVIRETPYAAITVDFRGMPVDYETIKGVLSATATASTDVVSAEMIQLSSILFQLMKSKSIPYNKVADVYTNSKMDELLKTASVDKTKTPVAAINELVKNLGKETDVAKFNELLREFARHVAVDVVRALEACEEISKMDSLSLSTLTANPLGYVPLQNGCVYSPHFPRLISTLFLQDWSGGRNLAKVRNALNAWFVRYQTIASNGALISGINSLNSLLMAAGTPISAMDGLSSQAVLARELAPMR